MTYGCAGPLEACVQYGETFRWIVLGSAVVLACLAVLIVVAARGPRTRARVLLGASAVLVIAWLVIVWMMVRFTMEMFAVLP